MGVLRDEPRPRRDDVSHDRFGGRIVPRDVDRHLEPTTSQRGGERLEVAAIPEQPLLAQACVGYPNRRDAPRVDLGIVIAGEELDVRAASLSERCGARQYRLLLL